MTQIIPKGFKKTEIGIIPEDWEIVTFNDVSEIIGGGTPSTKNESYFGGEISWLTPKDLSGYSKKYISRGARNITKEGLKNSSAKLMPKGTVLLTSRAPVGYVAIAENEVTTNQGFKSLICDDEKLNNYYLYYYLKNNKDYLEGHASGSTFKELSGSTLKKLKFPLPPLPQQQKIAQILSSLDDKIELLEKQNKTLENIGQAIFKSWFVDFEPFKDDLVESEMGMIPRRWKVGKIADLVELKGGFSFKSSDYVEGGKYGVITIKNVNDGKFDITTINYIDQIPTKMKDWCYLVTGDILMSLTGNVGRVCIVNGDNYLLNQRVVKMIPKSYITKGFIYFYFRQKILQDKLISISRGTAQMNLSPIETMNLEILLPKGENFRKYNIISQDYFDKINKNNTQIQTLSNLRDSLLPRLMNGKVKV